jgi:septum formation protein
MLILASASPRRQELLRNAGFTFTVEVADVDESSLPNEQPEACALRLARAKAEAVLARRPEAQVLGADTIVVVDPLAGVAARAAGETPLMLGKPRDADDAARMLRLLSGRAHRVLTGVCLAGPDGVEARVESTTVYMRAIPEAEIAAYIAGGEPMDKAGAYAIQGGASRWVTRIEGCYFNVVGLPVALVAQMLG